MSEPIRVIWKSRPLPPRPEMPRMPKRGRLRNGKKNVRDSGAPGVP